MRFVCDYCNDITKLTHLSLSTGKSLRNLLAIRSARSTRFA